MRILIWFHQVPWEISVEIYCNNCKYLRTQTIMQVQLHHILEQTEVTSVYWAGG